MTFPFTRYLKICTEEDSDVSKKFCSSIAAAAGLNGKTAVVSVNPHAVVEEEEAAPSQPPVPPSPASNAANPPKPAGGLRTNEIVFQGF